MSMIQKYIIFVGGTLALFFLGLFLASPAQAQMAARCDLFPDKGSVQVEATSTVSNFDIVVRDGRCLLFIRQRAEASFTPGKRAAWFIDGKDGDILAEFWGPANGGRPFEPGDVGLCSFRGGIPFKTEMCPWSVWIARSARLCGKQCSSFPNCMA